jgi:YidC/Oxa1 family membrane protein insertase
LRILQLCNLQKASLTTIRKRLVKLTIANKGGYIVEATLKNMKFKRSGQLVELIKDNNAKFKRTVVTLDNHF